MPAEASLRHAVCPALTGETQLTLSFSLFVLREKKKTGRGKAVGKYEQERFWSFWTIITPPKKNLRQTKSTLLAYDDKAISGSFTWESGLDALVKPTGSSESEH